jgi:hypothetical protein
VTADRPPVKIDMRGSIDMPQLHEHPASFGMHGINYFLPTSDVRILINAGRTKILPHLKGVVVQKARFHFSCV